MAVCLLPPQLGAHDTPYAGPWARAACETRGNPHKTPRSLKAHPKTPSKTSTVLGVPPKRGSLRSSSSGSTRPPRFLLGFRFRLRVRAWGLGGLGAWGMGCKQGLGFRVSGLGFRDAARRAFWDPKLWVQDQGLGASGSCKIPCPLPPRFFFFFFSLSLSIPLFLSLSCLSLSLSLPLAVGNTPTLKPQDPLNPEHTRHREARPRPGVPP